MNEMMHLDVWLYGDLKKYGGEVKKMGVAHLTVDLQAGGCMQDLFNRLGLPTAERGITFVNGNLSALPGLQPDLKMELKDADRVALFDLKSMWPFQYRHGAAMTGEMRQVLETDPAAVMHHVHEEE